MKTIEKIAADQISHEFGEKNSERIQQMISSQQALQIAKKNYNEAAQPLITEANKLFQELEKEFSDEGLKYFQERMKEISKIPFGEKK
jgi:hypothetical protein